MCSCFFFRQDFGCIDLKVDVAQFYGFSNVFFRDSLLVYLGFPRKVTCYDLGGSENQRLTKGIYIRIYIYIN